MSRMTLDKILSKEDVYDIVKGLWNYEYDYKVPTRNVQKDDVFRNLDEFSRDLKNFLLSQYPYEFTKKILQRYPVQILYTYLLSIKESSSAYSRNFGPTIVPLFCDMFDDVDNFEVISEGMDWSPHFEISSFPFLSMILFEVHMYYDNEQYVDRYRIHRISRRDDIFFEHTKNSFRYKINGAPLHLFREPFVVRSQEKVRASVHFCDLDYKEVAIGGTKVKVIPGGIVFLNKGKLKSIEKGKGK